LLLSLGDESEDVLTRLRESLQDGYADLQVRAAEIMGSSGREEFIQDLERVAMVYTVADSPTFQASWFEARRELRSRVAAAAERAAERIKRREAPTDDRRSRLRRTLPSGEIF
jgi:hypothetical protein